MNEHIGSTDKNEEQTDNDLTYPLSHKNILPNTNMISSSPLQNTDSNEYMPALSKGGDIEENIDSNVAEERNGNIINEDIEIMRYDNHNDNSQEYKPEGSDTSLEEEESSDIITKNAVDDITSSDSSSIKPITYNHKIKEHRYNLRSKRNRDYSKHVGKIDMGEDYIFMKESL